MSEFKVGDKVVWKDKAYADMWFPDTIDDVLTVSLVNKVDVNNTYITCDEFSRGEYARAERFEKYAGVAMKIRVNTDIYEYMGLKKGEIVDAYPMTERTFQFDLNGKIWVLDHKDVLVMDIRQETMECRSPYCECEEGKCINGWIDKRGEPLNTFKVKSNGGSSDYYKLTITNKKGETFECETGDIIRCMLGNDFSLGNCLKALRRMYLDSIGSGKEGVDLEYDGNKVKWFTDEFVHFNKKERVE